LTFVLECSSAKLIRLLLNVYYCQLGTSNIVSISLLPFPVRPFQIPAASNFDTFCQSCGSHKVCGSFEAVSPKVCFQLLN